MKKLISILASTLLLVSVVLAVLGSGGEYAAERLLYYAAKDNAKVALNPDVVPPAMLVSIERNLKNLVKQYPKTISARTAHVALMEFYINNKKFGEALSFSSVINKDYAGDIEILGIVQFLRGVTYEKMHKWDKALVEFKTLREKYPKTQIGMQIPIYIGKYYESKGMDAEAKAAYRDAARFYIQMVKDNENKVRGYTSSVFLLQTYLNLKDFESAGKVLEDTLHKFASDMSFAQLLPAVEDIYIKNLGNTEKAMAIYKYALSHAKDTRIKDFVNHKIAELKK